MNKSESINSLIDALVMNENAVTEIFNNFFYESWGISLVEESSTVQNYPDEFNTLKSDFHTEFYKISEEIVKKQNADWRQAFTGDFTFVNKRLNDHYKLSATATTNNEWVKLDVSDLNRSGLLTTGLNLAAHSAGKYSSMVHRGIYVLNKLLCQTIPEVPENIEELLEEFNADENDTVTERIEKRAESASCGFCHKHFDPQGMIFENFDALGVFHAERYGEPVNSSATIDDKAISNPRELAEHIVTKPETAQCIYNNLFKFSSGYSLEVGESIIEADEANAIGNNFNDLIKHVITNDKFYKLSN